MRLIDADALIVEIKTCLWDWESVNGIKAKTVLNQTITDIGNMPTIEPLTVIDYIELADRYGGEVAFVVKDMIEHTGRRWGNEEPPKMDDVVKVVRCKDCKWWGDLDPKNRYTDCYCHVVECSTEPDWFCADGERKDDE